jgi:hypothetical protein
VPWTAQSRCNGCRLWDCACIQVFLFFNFFLWHCSRIQVGLRERVRAQAREGGGGRERGARDFVHVRACVFVQRGCMLACLRCAQESARARMRVREIHVRGVHVCICVPPHPLLPSVPRLPIAPPSPVLQLQRPSLLQASVTSHLTTTSWSSAAHPASCLSALTSPVVGYRGDGLCLCN